MFDDLFDLLDRKRGQRRDRDGSQPGGLRGMIGRLTDEHDDDDDRRRGDDRRGDRRHSHDDDRDDGDERRRGDRPSRRSSPVEID